MNDLVTAVIVKRLQVRSDQVSDDADLVADLGADSLALAEICAELETQTGITFSMDQLQEVNTVGDVRKLIPALPKPELSSNSPPGHLETGEDLNALPHR